MYWSLTWNWTERAIQNSGLYFITLLYLTETVSCFVFRFIVITHKWQKQNTSLWSVQRGLLRQFLHDGDVIYRNAAPTVLKPLDSIYHSAVGCSYSIMFPACCSCVSLYPCVVVMSLLLLLTGVGSLCRLLDLCREQRLQYLCWRRQGRK